MLLSHNISQWKHIHFAVEIGNCLSCMQICKESYYLLIKLVTLCGFLLVRGDAHHHTAAC